MHNGVPKNVFHIKQLVWAISNNQDVSARCLREVHEQRRNMTHHQQQQFSNVAGDAGAQEESD